MFEDILVERFQEELFEKSQEKIVEIGATERLPDRYLAMSLLQKSVRRSDLKLAWRAGRYLLQENPSLLWRRLAVMAIEDLGVADPSVVMKIMLVCSDSKLRNTLGGPVQSAFCAIKLLAEAPKDRSTDDLFELLIRDPDIMEMRADLAETSGAQLQRTLNPNTDNVVRMALAILSVAGEIEPNVYQARKITPWIDAIVRLPDNSVSPCDKQVALLALRKTRLLLAPMIAALAPFRPQDLRSTDDSLLSERFVEGLPTWALSQHTRVGLDGFRKYVSRSGRFKVLLSEAATGEVSKSKVIGGLVFRLDCGKLSNRMDWSIGFDLEARATRLGWGILDEGVPEALEILKDEWELLNDCRCEALSNYLR